MIAISLAVETLSGSLIPDELVKFVEVIPISPAFSFIMSAKFDSEPAIPSANATQASFHPYPRHLLDNQTLVQNIASVLEK